MPGHVLQLTDLHLFADAAATLKGVCTLESFRTVWRRALETAPDCDAIILTGDLTHDEQEDTYRALRGELGNAIDRCYFLPGNHDNRTLMRRVFADRIADSESEIGFSFCAAGWRLIGLDTHVPGAIYGGISREQLDSFEAELAQYSGQPTAVFLHHPPVPVGSRWLDAVMLENPEPFLGALSRAPHVKFVCCGHVHQEFTGLWGAVTIWTTPATSVQFRPGADVLVVDNVAPGFRVLELAGSTSRSIVVRVPDMPASHVH